MAELAVLKQKRKLNKAAFTRMLNYCSGENVQLADVQVRVERAEILFKEYEELQDKIDQLIDDETQISIEEQYRADIEGTFLSIKACFYRLRGDRQSETGRTPRQNNELSAAMQALIEHQTSMSSLVERFANELHAGSTSTPNVVPQPQYDLRLPTIQIPEFDGNLLEWVRFKELFETLIHNKPNISAIEKLEYLQTKLKGDALLIIKHLKPMHSNYAVAWELLNKKYNNTEKIKNTYIELLFEQQPMKTSSLSEAKRIYNSASEGFNALKAIDTNIGECSSVLLYNVEKKLDSGTAILWFRHKQQHQPTTFDTK